jgi:hypothetical protein
MARKAPRRQRARDTRADLELERLRDEVRGQRATIDQCCRDIEMQFTRIAQMQAELDEVRQAWARASPTSRARHR